LNLPRFTENTITDKGELEKELDKLKTTKRKD